jgi:hypothetical protein
MSCPFFYASEPLSSVRELRPVPLGRLYKGECRARGLHPSAYLPSETALRAWCNFGYARGDCPHFPVAAEADAVRFSIAHADIAVITVRYCLERDHRPVDHGTLTFHCAAGGSGGGLRLDGAGAFDPPHSNAMVSRLAEAYVASYLARRKS